MLFNRFYQPDIELETLEISPNILLSTPMAMRLPMRWIAMLYGRIGASLAATSGIHRATDALKMLMAGADVTMLCSILLRRGIEHIQVIEREMREWMEEHEYESVEQLKGSMSQKNCPDPSAFERAQYMRALETYPAAESLGRQEFVQSNCGEAAENTIKASVAHCRRSDSIVPNVVRTSRRFRIERTNSNDSGDS